MSKFTDVQHIESSQPAENRIVDRIFATTPQQRHTEVRCTHAGSRGLSAHMHFAEDAIDFNALRTIDPDLYVSAYNVSDGKMDIWGKDMITAQTSRAF